MAKRDDAGLILVGEERPWANLPNDLLHEILSRLFAGDRVMFRSVCSSWSFVSPLPPQHHLGPLAEPDRSHPYLMYANQNIFHPINGDIYPLDFPDMSPWAKIRSARDGWLIMKEDNTLFFFNPFTKNELPIPLIGRNVCTQYLSKPPTSKDWLVVAAVWPQDGDYAIYSIRSGDENWTMEILLDGIDFKFSQTVNVVVHNGLYFLLCKDARLFIYDPKTKKYQIHEPPESVSQIISEGGTQYKLEREEYMLESDGKLLFVFVGYLGKPVHLFQWNLSTRTWETLESLGNKMLFVSRPLSVSIDATIMGTGNKIYFPRFVGRHGLFYSLSTEKYHTFEMGTYRQGFEGSEFPLYATWIMP